MRQERDFKRGKMIAARVAEDNQGEGSQMGTNVRVGATREELISGGLVRPAGAQADPPREPTIADRRRVSEALDAHYDIRNERYLQSFSDEALATQLGVPRKWVEDVRSTLFGAGVGCENDSRIDASIEDLEQRIDGVQKLLGGFREELKMLKAMRK